MTKESMIYQLLDELKISYDRLDHEPISSVIEAAEKGIVLPGQQVKNLLLKNKGTSILFGHFAGRKNGRYQAFGRNP